MVVFAWSSTFVPRGNAWQVLIHHLANMEPCINVYCMLQRAFAQDASKIKELLELVSNQLQASKIKILTAKENS